MVMYVYYSLLKLSEHIDLFLFLFLFLWVRCIDDNIVVVNVMSVVGIIS